MATPAIWAGSASFFAGDSTPFGYYDYDPAFPSDAEKVANWIATRLGYPEVDIELQDVNIFACFEEAVSEYTAQVNYMNIKNNLFNLQGLSTGSNTENFTQRYIEASLHGAIRISQTYGSEAGVGGTVDWKSGSVDLTPGKQDYDLDLLWSEVSESGRAIEVKRVFFEHTPAISRFFDPYIGTGLGSQQLLDEFAWGNYSPAVNFILMPMHDDLLRIQAIEFNDMIRKSQYSFQLINNKLRIFPIPNTRRKLWFQYIVTDERSSVSGSSGLGKIADFSNIPYQNANYCHINAAGKQWIKMYTLALAKEILGNIRGKYQSIPGTKDDISLDGDTLRAEAATEKEALITQIREDLEQVSRRNMLERESEIVGFQRDYLDGIPMGFYVG